MATIAFDTLAAADARSRELWTAVLGRAKYPQDVTEYAFSRTVLEDDTPVIVVAERDAMLDGLIRADQMTADEIAALVELYPAYQVGAAYSVDDLLAYDGLLYRVVQAHTSQSDWRPDRTPALYTPATPEEVIGEWRQPLGSFDAYNLGALVTFGGQVWRSTIDANVWAPGVYGWEMVEP